MTVDEWDHREVCPDGACTGVIGPEGRCKTCGRVEPAWNNERERGLVEPASEEPDNLADEDDDDLEGEAAADERDAALAPEASTDDHQWSRRELCSDGACVGVIGPTGGCTVCGKPPV